MISWSQARVASAILSSIVLGSLLVSCTPDLVGVVYGLLNVRLPAPPVVALVGLLRNILSKLGAKDRTHAAMIGLKRGVHRVLIARKSLGNQPIGGFRVERLAHNLWRYASTILHLCPRPARRRTLAHALVVRTGEGRSRGFVAAGRAAAGSRPISDALDCSGATLARGAMDAGGGNAGGGRGAVECLLVRPSVALDHAGYPGRRPGTDRAGRVVHRRTPFWLEATRDSRSKESGLAALMSEFSHP